MNNISDDILPQKKISKMHLEVRDLEVLITSITTRGKTRVMLHTGAGQIILKLFGYDIFCNNLQHKTISSKFGGIRGIYHLRYK